MDAVELCVTRNGVNSLRKIVGLQGAAGESAIRGNPIPAN